MHPTLDLLHPPMFSSDLLPPTVFPSRLPSAINGGFSGKISTDSGFLNDVGYLNSQLPSIPPQPPPPSSFSYYPPAPQYYPYHNPQPATYIPQYTTNPSSYQPYHSINQSHAHTPPDSSPPLQLTVFSGSNPNLWLLNTECYFLKHPYPVEIRLQLIGLYMHGQALTWFRLVLDQIDTWEKFKDDFKWQFITGPARFSSSKNYSTKTITPTTKTASATGFKNISATNFSLAVAEKSTATVARNHVQDENKTSPGDDTLPRSEILSEVETQVTSEIFTHITFSVPEATLEKVDLCVDFTMEDKSPFASEVSAVAKPHDSSTPVLSSPISTMVISVPKEIRSDYGDSDLNIAAASKITHQLFEKMHKPNGCVSASLRTLHDLLPLVFDPGIINWEKLQEAFTEHFQEPSYVDHDKPRCDHITAEEKYSLMTTVSIGHHMFDKMHEKKFRHNNVDAYFGKHFLIELYGIVITPFDPGIVHLLPILGDDHVSTFSIGDPKLSYLHPVKLPSITQPAKVFLQINLGWLGGHSRWLDNWLITGAPASEDTEHAIHTQTSTKHVMSDCFITDLVPCSIFSKNGIGSKTTLHLFDRMHERKYGENDVEDNIDNMFLQLYQSSILVQRSFISHAKVPQFSTAIPDLHGMIIKLFDPGICAQTSQVAYGALSNCVVSDLPSPYQAARASSENRFGGNGAG